MLKKVSCMLDHMRWLFKFFKGNCRYLPFLAALEGVIPIGTVFFSKVLLQELMAAKDLKISLWWVLIIIGLQLISKLILHYRTIWIKAQLSNTKFECMETIASAYEAVDLATAESEEMVNAKEKAVNSIEFNDSIRNMIDSCCTLISSIVMIGGSVFIIADLNIALIIVVAVSFIPQFIINTKKKNFDFGNMKKWIDLNRKTNCYTSLLTEIKTIKEIQLYNAKELIYGSITEIDKKRTYELIRQNNYHTFLDFCFYLVRAVNDALIYGYLVVKLLVGSILIPDFTLYIGGISNLSKAIENIAGSYISLKQYVNYLDVYHLFVDDNNNHKSCDEEVSKLPIIDTIEFCNVSFKYPGQEHYALENISVVLHKNEHISIVGRNGAGKTTFVKLLLGLYKPSKGEIKVNGISIDKYSRAELNKMYSVLFQDYNIFPISAYENVTLQEKKGQYADIKWLYDSVGIQSKLEKLSQYDDTVVSPVFEDGVDLSGGEKLKLAIARAMYIDSSIIVLDEPSSALDPKAEFEFYQMINKMHNKRTVIFVSHRMSSSMFSDRILVFDHAQLMGDGNHRFLYVANSLYKSLFDAQVIE